MKKIFLFLSLFFVLTSKAQVLSIGVDSATGSPMFRQLDYFTGGVIDPKITIHYRQWLLTPSGKKYNEENDMVYFVMDIPAVIKSVLKKPAVMDSTFIITPAVYADSIFVPADMKYTEWKTKRIVTQMVGAKLGDDLIIGRINYTLQLLPTNVKDKIINP